LLQKNLQIIILNGKKFKRDYFENNIYTKEFLCLIFL